MDKYRNSLINNASKLDAVTDSCGEITKLATMIVEESSREATITLLKRISDVIGNRSYGNEKKQIAQLLHMNLIEYYGYSTLQTMCKGDSVIKDDPRTLQELLAELNALVGLETVNSAP